MPHEYCLLTTPSRPSGDDRLQPDLQWVNEGKNFSPIMVFRNMSLGNYLLGTSHILIMFYSGYYMSKMSVYR